jgi:predicted aspartyl protease
MVSIATPDQPGSNRVRGGIERATVTALALLAMPVMALAFAVVVGAVTLAALAIVVVPPLAPTGFVRHAARPAAFFATLFAWSLCVLCGFPLFFPGERGEAIGTGVAIVGVPSFVESAVSAIERQLPTLGHARRPPPVARRQDAVSVGDASPRQIELATEPVGNALVVTVTFEGRLGKRVTLRMLLDTGASFTTLTRSALEQIGLPVDDASPVVKLGTAAGEVLAHLALVDRVLLNSTEIPAVTIAVCDACESHDVAGLLGLNVLGHFLVTLDGAHQRVLLERRPGAANRALDVSPWLKVRALATSWLDGRVEVDVTVTNDADRLIGDAEVAIRCDTTFVAELHDVPARGTASTLVRLPRGVRCDDYTAPLERATW